MRVFHIDLLITSTSKMDIAKYIYMLCVMFCKLSTFCFSMSTMVTRTRFSVALYVHRPYWYMTI